MTLEQAIRSFDDTQLLDDGADNWTPSNLIDALEETEEGKQALQQEVYCDESGISAYNEQGFIQSVAMYRVRYEND